jgi:hypothetical protein
MPNAITARSGVGETGCAVAELNPRFVTLLPSRFFCSQFHGGLKEVAIEPQGRIQLIEQAQLRFRVITLIAHRAAHYGVALLLDKTVVAFTVRPRAREAQYFLWQ